MMPSNQALQASAALVLSMVLRVVSKTPAMPAEGVRHARIHSKPPSLDVTCSGTESGEKTA